MLKNILKKLFTRSVPANVQELIEKSADWWAEQLRNPNLYNGNLRCLEASVALEMITSPNTEEAIAAFRGRLVEYLTEVYRKEGILEARDLSVDYHPEGLIRTMGEQAGISRWPIKTSLYILRATAHRGEVRGCAGVKSETIFAY